MEGKEKRGISRRELLALSSGAAAGVVAGHYFTRDSDKPVTPPAQETKQLPKKEKEAPKRMDRRVAPALERAADGPIGNELLLARSGVLRNNYRQFVETCLEAYDGQREPDISKILEERNKILSDRAFKLEVLNALIERGLYTADTDAANSLTSVLGQLNPRWRSNTKDEKSMLKSLVANNVDKIKLHVDYKYFPNARDYTDMRIVTFIGPTFSL